MQVLTPMTLYDSTGRGLTVYAPSTLTPGSAPPAPQGAPTGQAPIVTLESSQTEQVMNEPQFTGCKSHVVSCERQLRVWSQRVVSCELPGGDMWGACFEHILNIQHIYSEFLCLAFCPFLHLFRMLLLPF